MVLLTKLTWNPGMPCACPVPASKKGTVHARMMPCDGTAGGGRAAARIAGTAAARRRAVTFGSGGGPDVTGATGVVLHPASRRALKSVNSAFIGYFKVYIAEYFGCCLKLVVNFSSFIKEPTSMPVATQPKTESSPLVR